MELKEFEFSLKKQYSFLSNVNVKFIQTNLFYQYILKRLFRKEIESTYDLTEDQIYDLLNHIVNWYHKFGSSAHPDEILDYRDKIVTSNYWLIQRLSNKQQKYNQKSQHNQIEIDRHISQQSKVIGTHAARSQAKSNKYLELMQESEYKSEISRIENLIKRLDKIDSAMQQRIAWLRQEASKTTQF